MHAKPSTASRPVIAVFFDAPGYMEYPFDDPDYFSGYHQLGKLLAEREALLIIVRSQGSYKSRSTFARGWVFDGATFQRSDVDVKASVIWNKGHLKTDPGSCVINEPELDELCTDKLKTAEHFPEYSPATRLGREAWEVGMLASEIPGTFIVAKPPDLEAGQGVLIGPREEVLQSITTYPVLLQEFIDTSGGIPSLARGRHDLRIISMRGKPIVSYMREPQDGTYVSNVAQGGRLTEVALSAVPPDALALWKKVDDTFTRFPFRFYTTDVGLHSSGAWKLIELNAKPGISHFGEFAGARKFMERLADFLVLAGSQVDGRATHLRLRASDGQA